MALHVFFAHRATQTDQAKAGFGVGFDWDVDLVSGYEHVFMTNVARRPGLDRFGGCDTPSVLSHLGSSESDCVLIMGWQFKAYVQAAIAAKRLGLPLLVRGDSQLDTPRGMFKRAAKNLIYPGLLRAFDAALYVGERSKAYWHHYRYPESRLFFSPHCVDNDWFAARATTATRDALRAKLGISPETKVLLFVGKLQPFKRPTDLVAAAAHLNKMGEQIAVIVAGAGEMADEISQVAKSVGVVAHLLGFCNQTEMPAIYAASDVLVLPSEHETWGLVANEALACGKPIVLADTVGSAPDLAADGSAGRVYPAGNILSLADNILDVLNAPPSREMIAAKSEKYSIVAAADGMCDALDALQDVSGNHAR